MIRAAELLLERGYGKAPAFHTNDPAEFRDVLELTDAQIRDRLAAIRAELLRHGIDPLDAAKPERQRRAAKGGHHTRGGRRASSQSVEPRPCPLAIARLGEILRDPKSKDGAVIRATELLLERGYGKAPAFHTNDPVEFRDVLELTDAQIRDRLAAIRAELLRHGIDPLDAAQPERQRRASAIARRWSPPPGGGPTTRPALAQLPMTASRHTRQIAIHLSSLLPS